MPIDNLEDWLYAAHSREHSGKYDDVKLGPIKKIIAAMDTAVPGIMTTVTIASEIANETALSAMIQLLISCNAAFIPHTRNA